MVAQVAWVGQVAALAVAAACRLAEDILGMGIPVARGGPLPSPVRPLRVQPPPAPRSSAGRYPSCRDSLLPAGPRQAGEDQNENGRWHHRHATWACLGMLPMLSWSSVHRSAGRVPNCSPNSCSHRARRESPLRRRQCASAHRKHRARRLSPPSTCLVQGRRTRRAIREAAGRRLTASPAQAQAPALEEASGQPISRKHRRGWGVAA